MPCLTHPLLRNSTNNELFRERALGVSAVGCEMAPKSNITQTPGKLDKKFMRKNISWGCALYIVVVQSF
jgi:hypothetical protein